MRFAIGAVAGTIGMLLVFLGDQLQWPGFCARAGYWGTHWLSIYLYSMGSDSAALWTVAILWFIYLFTATFVIGGIMVKLARRTGARASRIRRR